MQQHFCIVCGKPVGAEHPRAKYCPECRKKAKAESNAAHRSYRKIQKQMQKELEESDDYVPPKSIVSHRDEIIDICAKAKAKGMSYGMYVAKYGYRGE